MAGYSPEFQKMLDETKAQIKEISVDELNHLVSETEEKITMVDVREDYEWDEGHIFDALHLSRGMLEFIAAKYLPKKDAQIIVYCRSGGRSALATKSLQDLGYSNVKSLAGGITGWIEAELEIDGDLLSRDEHFQLLEDQMNPMMLSE